MRILLTISIQQSLNVCFHESKHLEIAEYLLSKGCAYKENKDNKGECIIFKMPNNDISFNDGIKGRLKKPIGDIDDFVLVRSNGKPVFHLSALTQNHRYLLLVFLIYP